MTKYMYLLTFLLLVGCVKGGGGGGENPPPTPTNPGTANFTLSAPEMVFLGLNNRSTAKTVTINVVNTGTDTTPTISLSSTVAAQIAMTSTCAGKKLAPATNCSITFTLNSAADGGFKKSVTVTAGSKSATIPSYGFVYDLNKLNTMISKISDKQSFTTDTGIGLYQGAWQSDFNVNHLSSNAIIIDALISANSYSATPLFTSNLNFNTSDPNDWKMLDSSLYFMAINDKETISQADDTFIKFDPTIAGTEYSTAFTKWNDSEYNTPKKISASVINVINKNHKLIYGADLANYSSVMSTYIDSRRIMSSDNVSSTTDITAQMAYLFDVNRMNTSGYVENAFKDVILYYDYFTSINDTASLNKISKFLINHWEYDFDELQNQPSIFSPSLNLRYNPNERVYSSNVQPGSTFSDKLWWVIDYQASGFTNTYTCRDIGYDVLSLAQAYNHGNLTASDKAKVALLIQDGLIEIANVLACNYDASSKKFLSQNDTSLNNGIPLIFRLYQELPISIISVDKKIEIYNQLIVELGTGGSLDLDGTDPNPLYLAESLKAFVKLIQ